MAQSGMSRAIYPVHTPLDGDVVFAVSTGRRPLADPLFAMTTLGTLAANVVARAIARAIFEADSAPLPRRHAELDGSIRRLNSAFQRRHYRHVPWKPQFESFLHRCCSVALFPLTCLPIALSLCIACVCGAEVAVRVLVIVVAALATLGLAAFGVVAAAKSGQAGCAGCRLRNAHEQCAGVSQPTIADRSGLNAGTDRRTVDRARPERDAALPSRIRAPPTSRPTASRPAISRAAWVFRASSRSTRRRPGLRLRTFQTIRLPARPRSRADLR